ncbi:MAG TPA: HAMP domain-containing sensor histidine kinase [Oscillatoriaceae cyanobacterium]
MPVQRRLTSNLRSFGPYAWAIAAVVVCTLIDRLMFGRAHQENLVLVYLLGTVAVALLGNSVAAVVTAFLAVAAFDFFFTRPYFTLAANDPGYYFTFLVMAVVGALISYLTSHLAREVRRNRQRAEEAEAYEHELAEAHRKLLTLDQLKASLINNVSHELRTPLATIEGNAELLQDHVAGTLNTPQEEFVAQIQIGSKRLERMVDYLLDFSQLECGRFTFDIGPCDLRAVVSEAADQVAPAAKAAKLELEIALPEQPVELDIDAQRIRQVIFNLLDNAIKFTPAGGRVEATLSADERNASVSVRDTGIGIDAAHLPHVFDKFYQVDPTSTRARGGAGLGLSFSKALIEGHGGRLEVHSTPGSGSTFAFTLPRHRVQPVTSVTIEGPGRASFQPRP